MEKWKIVLGLTILIGFLLVVISLSIQKEEVIFKVERISDNNITEEKIIEECDGGNLFEDSVCLNEYVKKIYKYRLNFDSNSLTFDELKEEGGDCYDYTRFYCNILTDEYKFNCNQIKIRSGTDTSHIIALAYNEEGYVVLDMKDIFMFKYEDIEK